MKIQFKSEEAMEEFRVLLGVDPSSRDHNYKFVQKYGMSVIEIKHSTEHWWDILDSNGGLEYTIDVNYEGHLFNIIE